MGANDTGVIGQSIKRKEDVRFLTGAGQFTDDVNQPNQVHAVFLRSPHAHARIRKVDTAKAKGQATELKFAAFGARQTKGQGRFFTRAQLDQASGRPLANLLKADAGAFIADGPRGESLLAMRSPTGGASPCYTAVVRDGVRIYPFTGATPPNLDKIFAEQLLGVELYARPATVPAELRVAAKCGALVLWTRDAK